MQIGKLTLYELKKTMRGHFFAVTVVLLFVTNSFIWCGNWKNFGNPRSVVESNKRNYEILSGLTTEEFEFFQAAMREKYGEDVFSPFFIPTAEIMQPDGYFGEGVSDFDVVSSYAFLEQENEIREALYQQVINAAKAFGREAVANGNNYEIRRNLNIIRRYSVPRSRLQYTVSGWGDLILDSRTMVLVFLLVLQCSAGSFTKEIEPGTILLLHTAKNGKWKTLAAKFLASAICAAGFTVLFQAGSLLTIYLNHGLLGIGQTVTGIQELRLCPLNITVGQFVLLTIACRIFAAVILSVLLTAVSAFSRSGAVSYGVSMILLGAGVGFMLYPLRSEWMAGPLALVRTERYFDAYYTMNFLGYPWLWAVVQAVLWLVLGIICILLAGKKYCRKKKNLWQAS